MKNRLMPQPHFCWCGNQSRLRMHTECAKALEALRREAQAPSDRGRQIERVMRRFERLEKSQ